jgi:DNA modification methylase
VDSVERLAATELGSGVTYRILQGDCIEVMRGLPEASVDAVVTDPPYHLAFMGKAWDTVTPGESQHRHEEWAREALRVLKPGGFLLAFGGTRTYHRLASGIEDAGFEIRDSIAWQHLDHVFCQCDRVDHYHSSNGHGDVHGVREDVPDARGVAETGEGADVQPPVQRGSSGSGVGGARPQGTGGTQDAGAPEIRVGQPSVEGRRHVLPEEGELPGGEVRPLAGVGEADGASGRLRDGAPAPDGDDDRLPADADGGRASQGPRPAEQRADEPRGVAVEWIAQGGGAWPGCPGCGKPLAPPFFGGPLTWQYGSGFPKSLDVSKAIDKRRDDTAAVQNVRAWLEEQRKRSGLTYKAIDRHLGVANSIGKWTVHPTDVRIPTWEQWLQLRDLLNLPDDMDAEVWRLNGRKGTPGEAWDQREVVGTNPNVQRSWRSSSVSYEVNTGSDAITAPATREAQAWDGWGTALKPAHEPIVVARKPLSGTVAGNVLAYGTGALNIAATRVGTSPDAVRSSPGGSTACTCHELADDRTIRNGSTLPLTSSAEPHEQPGNPAPNGSACGPPTTSPLGSPDDCPSSARSDDAHAHRGEAAGQAAGPRRGDAPEPADHRPAALDSRDRQSMPCPHCTATDVQQGRWPSNVVLGHSVGCVPTGTRRVKTDDRSRPPRTPNAIYGGGKGTNLTPSGTPPADGLETVTAWECEPGCPVLALGEPARFFATFSACGDESSKAASTSDGVSPEAARSIPNPPTDGPGSKPTDPSHPDTRFTTSTGTLSTTTSRTSNSLAPPSTTTFTSANGKTTRSSPASSTDVASDATPTVPSTSSMFDVREPDRGTAESAPPRTSASGEGAVGTRAFYQAKSSSAERNAGLDGFEIAEPPFIGGNHGMERMGSLSGPRPNSHPTVKPIELMRWLIRLVTPPGGTVLDPFLGSGSTGAAAVLERVEFIGIERDAEYISIAQSRIAWWSEHPDGMQLVKRLEREAERKAVAESGQVSMFDLLGDA